MRVVGGGAEMGSGEYFLIFVSGGLTALIFFPPAIAEMKSLHCVLLHFHFEEFIWPPIKAQLPLHLGGIHYLGAASGRDITFKWLK